MGPFFVPTAAISVENTHNFAGGAVLPIGDLRDLREFATGVGAGIHLDGARIWNAHVATGTPFEEYGAIADVLSVCLSKGLGAPVGSVLVGSGDAVAEARVWRKRMGGGMRQVGILAAAGLHALDHHVERLADDHAHARLLAEACGVDPDAVDTNIVVVDRADAATFVDGGARRGRGGATVGPTAVRMVTHLDVSRDDAEKAAAVLARLGSRRGRDETTPARTVYGMTPFHRWSVAARGRAGRRPSRPRRGRCRSATPTSRRLPCSTGSGRPPTSRSRGTSRPRARWSCR